MKIMITERRDNERDSEIVKCLGIICPACSKQIYFRLSMLDYCSSLYCAYCGTSFKREDIIKKISLT